MTLLAYDRIPWLTPVRAFYILQAVLVVTLCAMLLLPRPSGRALTCLASILLAVATMESLTAICGLALYWQAAPGRLVPLDGGTCEQGSTQRIAWIVIAVAISILWGVSEWTSRRR